jgi:hypothetical protein
MLRRASCVADAQRRDVRDLPGQETAAERAVRHKANAELLAGGRISSAQDRSFIAATYPRPVLPPGPTPPGPTPPVGIL